MAVKNLVGVLVGILATLVTVSAGAMMQSTSKTQVNVRSGPGLEHAVLFQAPVGYPVEIKKENGQWVLVKDWEGDTGWVFRPLLCSLETAVVSVDRANVRLSPGVQHHVSGHALRGEIYRILERKGGWAKIGYYFGESVFGWIRQDLIYGD